MARRKTITALVTLSVKADATTSQARREVRTRVNESCCYSLDEEDVKVRKIGPAPKPTPTMQLGTHQSTILQLALIEFIESRKGQSGNANREAETAEGLRSILRDTADVGIGLIPATTRY